MDDVPQSMFVIMISVFLIATAFFSMVDGAVLHANRIRIKNSEAKKKQSKRAMWILLHQELTSMVMIIGKTMCNTIVAALFVLLMLQYFLQLEAFIFGSIVAGFLILLVSEGIPKIIVQNRADSIVLSLAPLIYWIVQFIRPLVVPFLKVNERIKKEKDSLPSVTEEELKEMIELSEEEGVINEKEKELVHSALEFNDIIVQEIVKPRIDVVAVEVNQSISEIKEVFLKERFSRIPVYEEDIDHIIGILSERDFFSALVRDENIEVRDLVMSPLFVMGTQKISELLKELQKRKMHMAIVIDEFGGTEGLVTMEDILEQLVGDIWDEHDEKIKVMTQINEHQYLFFADFPIDEFQEVLNVTIPDGNYHTLGGFIVEMLEHIPKEGEELHYGPLVITVTEVEKRRIRKVRVEVQGESYQEQLIQRPSLIKEPANG